MKKYFIIVVKSSRGKLRKYAMKSGKVQFKKFKVALL